ncbi:hypothetical protein [Pimelobacter simplex]|uniref:hypothetical protein n=1 Tax=Nocardioides simplex TaxID=2045 RepID=UPI003AAFFD7B
MTASSNDRRRGSQPVTHRSQVDVDLTPAPDGLEPKRSSSAPAQSGGSPKHDHLVPMDPQYMADFGLMPGATLCGRITTTDDGTVIIPVETQTGYEDCAACWRIYAAHLSALLGDQGGSVR